MIIRAAFLFRAKYRDCVPAFISHAFAQVSYRFNGKESQEFACLPYLDYGARYYSAVLPLDDDRPAGRKVLFCQSLCRSRET